MIDGLPPYPVHASDSEFSLMATDQQSLTVECGGGMREILEKCHLRLCDILSTCHTSRINIFVTNSLFCIF